MRVISNRNRKSGSGSFATIHNYRRRFVTFAISEATENNMVLEGNEGREESDSANVPQDGGPAGLRGIRVVPI